MMTVRTLIEHLAQLDSDLEVKIRNVEIRMILHDIPDHGVEVVEFCNMPSDASKYVVALG